MFYREIHYKYIFNVRGDEGHGRFDMGGDKWGLSKAAHHVLPQATCASWTVFVSSTAVAEEDLDVQNICQKCCPARPKDSVCPLRIVGLPIPTCLMI